MNWRRELVEQMKREQLDAAEMPLELPPPVGIIRVKQNVSGDGFLGNPAGAGGNGGHVWGASILLAQWLSGSPALSPYRSPALDLALPPEDAPKAIELGCGCGVISVVLAKLGYRVYATDADPASCRLTEANALHNGVAERISTHQLLWGNEQADALDELMQTMGGCPPIIVLSECVYEPQTTEYLAETLRALLVARTTTTIIHAWSDRDMDEESFLTNSLSDIVGGAAAETVARARHTRSRQCRETLTKACRCSARTVAWRSLGEKRTFIPPLSLHRSPRLLKVKCAAVRARLLPGLLRLLVDEAYPLRTLCTPSRPTAALCTLFHALLLAAVSMLGMTRPSHGSPSSLCGRPCGMEDEHLTMLSRFRMC